MKQLDDNVNDERRALRKIEAIERALESPISEEAKRDSKAMLDAAKLELAYALCSQGNFGSALDALGDLPAPELREMIKKKISS